jgi:hypothetical protein
MTKQNPITQIQPKPIHHPMPGPMSHIMTMPFYGR